MHTTIVSFSSVSHTAEHEHSSLYRISNFSYMNCNEPEGSIVLLLRSGILQPAVTQKLNEASPTDYSQQTCHVETTEIDGTIPSEWPPDVVRPLML